jgi:hypothetical protein
LDFKLHFVLAFCIDLGITGVCNVATARCPLPTRRSLPLQRVPPKDVNFVKNFQRIFGLPPASDSTFALSHAPTH